MLRKVLKSIAVTVMLAAVLGTAYLWIAKPIQMYVVHTGSMGNTVPSKSLVVVRTGQYHVGQVITFRTHGEIVTHRLLAIRSDGSITTKGDANDSKDVSHPPRSAIIGGVIAAPRQLGFWVVYVRQPLGLPSLLAAIALLYCIWNWTPKPDDIVAPVPT